MKKKIATILNLCHQEISWLSLWENRKKVFSIFLLSRVSNICDTLGDISTVKIPQTSYIATVNSRSSPQCWETFPSRWFYSIKHQSTIVNNAVEFFTSHFAVLHQTARHCWKWKEQEHLAHNGVPKGCFGWWCWNPGKKWVPEWHFWGWSLTCKQQRGLDS